MRHGMATVKSKKMAKTSGKNLKPARRRATRSAVKARPAARTNHKTPNGKSATAVQPVLNQQEQLKRERAQVEEELVALRLELQEAPEMTGDEVDLNVYEREKTLGLVATYERRLEEIDAAQHAAKVGKYGICERCGKTIDPERLKIFPETRLCVSCKNEVEREARRMLRMS
jgi:DnaK suppressor protein